MPEVRNGEMEMSYNKMPGKSWMIWWSVALLCFVFMALGLYIGVYICATFVLGGWVGQICYVKWGER